MKRKWFHSFWLFGIAIALLGVAGVSAVASYSLDWWTVDGGGTSSSSGSSFSLGGTIGQPDAGTSSGGTFTLEGGFWDGNSSPSTVNYPIFLPLVMR
jgi:hypothetical protein